MPARQGVGILWRGGAGDKRPWPFIPWESHHRLMASFQMERNLGSQRKTPKSPASSSSSSHLQGDLIDSAKKLLLPLGAEGREPKAVPQPGPPIPNPPPILWNPLPDHPGFLVWTLKWAQGVPQGKAFGKEGTRGILGPNSRPLLSALSPPYSFLQKAPSQEVLGARQPWSSPPALLPSRVLFQTWE